LFTNVVEPNISAHRRIVRLLDSFIMSFVVSDLLDRGTKFVLRKKPAGKLISKAQHMIEREYTILHALHRHNSSPSTSSQQQVPAPAPIVFCEDASVLGTPFYIMEFVEGRIFTDARMMEIPLQDRREW
jgi:aminoglycoside phosphotransferase (APT) family kinase protein